MNIIEIQALCSEGKIVWTEHVEKRMAQRNISRKDVKRCIKVSEVLEGITDRARTIRAEILMVDYDKCEAIEIVR